jgi:hypothetical protein
MVAKISDATIRCMHTGLSSNAPPKDYSLSPSKSARTFNAFLSISILASVFGNSILPEIQVDKFRLRSQSSELPETHA